MNLGEITLPRTGVIGALLDAQAATMSIHDYTQIVTVSGLPKRIERAEKRHGKIYLLHGAIQHLQSNVPVYWKANGKCYYQGTDTRYYPGDLLKWSERSSFTLVSQ